MKTILSIDGGGIRGIIPAVLLTELEIRLGKSVFEVFDLIAGTSTGGILGLGLTLPDDKNSSIALNSASKMLELYTTEGPNIFKKRWVDGIFDEWVLGEPKYDSSGIDTALSKYFGTRHLADCLTNTLVTGYDATGRQTCFFKSWDDEFNYFECKQVARATSAAPTYFAPLVIPGQVPITCIDGGVVANNPSVAAYVEGVRHRAEPLEDILLISLGTGSYEKSYPYSQVSHWRPAEWLLPMIDFFFDASNMASDYQMRALANNTTVQEKNTDKTGSLTYHRFQTSLDQHFDSLDDASSENINSLQTLGSKIFRQSQQAEFDVMVKNLTAAQAARTPSVWKKASRMSNVG